MKVQLSSVDVRVDGHFWRTGSVLNDTIEAGCDKLVIHFEVESDEDPALIAAVLRNSRKGCYVRGAIGVPIEDTLSVNGEPFDFDAYLHPHRDAEA